MREDVNSELQALRNHMTVRQLAPSEPIIADNDSHDYMVKIKGELKQARYIATTYPLEEDPAGPTLVCSYGLWDDIPYNYSSLMPK